MRQHGVDMWVMPMREYNEDPVFTVDRVARRRSPRGVARSTSSSTSARRQAARRARLRRAHRTRRRLAGRTLRGPPLDEGGRRRRGGAAVRRSSGATSSGRCCRTSSRSASRQGDRHRPLDASSLSPTGSRAASCQGMSAALGETWTARVQERRGAAARLRRLAPARGGGLLRAPAAAGLVADRRRCTRRAPSRPASPAPATWCGGGASASTISGSAPGSSRRSTCSEGRERRAARRGPGDRARATCCTATSASPRSG